MAFDFPPNPVPDQQFSSGSHTYVWNGYAWQNAGSVGTAGQPGDYVLKTGDVMTGHLTLNAPPVDPLHAATKQYIDSITGELSPVGNDGQAFVVEGTTPMWGAPIDAGTY